MDTSLINKHRKRFNFEEGKLYDHMVYYINIETPLDDEQVREFMERFRRQIAESTMIPMERFGLDLERITDD
jgi:hypothetical protein